FRILGAVTRYVGFFSPDPWDAAIPKDYTRWVHIAGRSPLKGTCEIVRTWEENPDLPSLTIVARTNFFGGHDCPHLHLVEGRVADAEFVRIQNEYGIHLCPSTAEGWGHTLVEGMFTQALVVTTDAPPMNEHVTAERGVLCPSSYLEPFHCGFR